MVGAADRLPVMHLLTHSVVVGRARELSTSRELFYAGSAELRLLEEGLLSLHREH